MSSPNDPTDPNIQRTPEYPPQPEYYGQAPGYPTYAQGNPPAQPSQPYPQQAPQPSPPYQPYPGQYAPPPMPPKKSNRTLWIVLGSVGGALLLLCITCSVLAVALGGQIGKQLGPAIGASVTLANFCTAMQEQDYATAYTQFSTDLQGRVTEDQFATNATKLDADLGRVTNCTTSSSVSSSGDSNGPTISDDRVTLNVGITRSGGATSGETTNTTSGRVTFVKEGSNFKIDTIDSIFELT